MFASAKGKATKVIGSTATVSGSVLLLSHITFRDCRVLIFSDNFLEIAVNKTRPDYVFFDSL